MATKHLLVLVVVLLAFVSVQGSSEAEMGIFSESQFTSMFAKFVKRFTKTFSTANMLSKLAAFKASVARITKHNAGKSKLKMGVTKFADLSPVEFKKQFLTLRMPKNNVGRRAAMFLQTEEGSLVHSEADEASFVEADADEALEAALFDDNGGNGGGKKKPAPKKPAAKPVAKPVTPVKPAPEKKEKNDPNHIVQPESYFGKTYPAPAQPSTPPTIDADGLPSYFSWTWKDAGFRNAVAIRSQKGCGACWAFAASTALEAALHIAGKSAGTLSPQQLMACSDSKYTSGCKGGWISFAWDAVKAQGAVSEANWPYVAKDGFPCEMTGKDLAVKPAVVTGYKHAGYTLKGWKQALMKSPLAFALDGSSLQDYESGVVTAADCASQTGNPSHAVVAVGWSGNNLIVQNSWAADWGLSGHFLLEMDPAQPFSCSTNGTAMYPTVA